ncbi:MAG: flagellar motor switch protein FliN [Rickettsiales bacterium]|nr:flagellar motor switch protein FliN [Rickettsiales bacterium]|tara:strand:- start:76 stop:453 length:378 start_codon:yes stop_codon:yes gene_type:complete
MVEEKNEQAVETEEVKQDDEQGKKAEGVETKGDEKVERSSLENLRVLENIDVKLTVEVGGAEIKLRELLRINEGSVIELERLAGDPLDILANGTIIAKGEVVMIGERFGIRFTEVVDPKERVQNL